ncbi:PQQ-binding-like beta-propeller repeat protein [Streptomyces sp. NPDC014872]|uniref:serine/threonine-protein kinase n=1 Tax=Streptomyces sp. NPDC014872 TaxID=3364926 RepID=UPI0036FC49E7
MPPLRGAGTDPEAEHPEYAGQYRLEARLGAGGMGVVHLARSASGLQLAVKVVHEHYSADPEFRARFRQEVGAARRVSGAFTAPVVDADPDAARPWMATLYVPGPTLSDQVKRNGPMAPAELRRLTAGLAEALRDIHRAGVIHRDLKPSNVLLSDSGPKVIDFGISRPYDSDLRTETGKLIGSPPYMAPEQFQRPREVGPAADVFALGSVLVHAATGRGPFDSDSPYIVAYQVVHDEADLAGVPGDLAPLIARCLAKDPAQRPTPDEVMTELRPPSYEAAAFVPTQRRRTERPPKEAAVARESAGAAGVGAWAGADETGAGTEADTHVSARTAGRDSDAAVGGGRRWRWPVVVAALVALGAGGVWAYAATGGSGGAGGRAKAPAVSVPAAWRTALPAAGGSTPVCHTYAAQGTGDTENAKNAKNAEGTGDGGDAGDAGNGAEETSGPAAALYCAAAGVAVARLDPGDGRVLWSRRFSGTGPAASVVSVSGGLVHTAVPGRKVRAYDPAKGERVWEADLSPYLGVPFAAGDTLLLTAEDGTTEALDSATGVSRWRRAVPGHQRPDYALYDGGPGLAYAFEHSADGATTLVTAVDAKTGRAAWQRRLDGMLTPVGTADGALVLTSMNEDAQTVGLVRYDPERRRVTRVELPFRMNEPEAVVGGGTAYLLARGGTLVAVDLRPDGGGTVHWQLETAAGRTSAPVLAAGDGSGRPDRLYFSAADGRLLAVDTEQGKLLGQTGPRLRNGTLTYASELPAPVAVGRAVFGTAPDGSVFAVDGEDPAHW